MDVRRTIVNLKKKAGKLGKEAQEKGAELAKTAVKEGKKLARKAAQARWRKSVPARAAAAPATPEHC